MAWKRLTINDLRTVLAEDEVEKLDQRSNELSGRIQTQLDNVADAFRGSWSAKGYTCDVRDHYVAPEYVLPILNYARWSIWTTFPGTESYSLTEPREKMYREAVELLKDPYIATSKPDYSDDPTLSGDASLSAKQDAAISLPWQKFPSFPFHDGYWDVYGNEMRKIWSVK